MQYKFNNYNLLLHIHSYNVIIKEMILTLAEQSQEFSHNSCVPEKFQVSSTGFEPMTSSMPVQCSNQLSDEVTQMRAGQFVWLMCFHERNDN